MTRSLLATLTTGFSAALSGAVAAAVVTVRVGRTPADAVAAAAGVSKREKRSR